MRSDNAIFISYAHVDNKPLTAEEKGWVELFHDRLGIRLGQLLGKNWNVRIWRDKKLQGNDHFGAEIIHQLECAGILVSILSPSYVTSEWCLKELNLFYRSAESNEGARLGDKSRIFKVVKTFLPYDQHPEVLQELLGYEFYEILDQEKGRAREFIPDPLRDTRYWEKLDDLVYDIKLLIETRTDGPRTQTEPAAAPIAPNKDAVYLALTTSDLAEERDKIKRELQQNGYVVLPDQEPPLTSTGFKQMVSAYLERCRLSVHLVGRHYGIVPEGENHSIVRLQHDLALERNGHTGFERLVWMPTLLEPADERQRLFIEQLQNFTDRLKGWELLQTRLEDLKTIIQTRLRQPKSSTPATIADDCPPLLYLICDELDDEAADPLVDYLFDRGLEVTRPLREGNQEQLAQIHRENLRLCDAVMIICLQASESWLQMKRLELMKLPGVGRDKPLLVKPFYLLLGQKTRAKEQFKTHEGEVIRIFDDFDTSLLAPFIERLKAAYGNKRQADN
jgi:hypothetical protein